MENKPLYYEYCLSETFDKLEVKPITRRYSSYIMTPLLEDEYDLTHILTKGIFAYLVERDDDKAKRIFASRYKRKGKIIKALEVTLRW